MKGTQARLNKRRGFSLLDLLCIVAVVGIAAALAIPALSGITSGYGLAAAADELASELNGARVMAVSRGSSFSVVFNTSANTYQVIDLSDPQNPTRVRKSLAEGLQIVSAPSTPIVFSSRGVARGGSVVLASESGRRIVVQVEPSGRTRVQDMSATYATEVH